MVPTADEPPPLPEGEADGRPDAVDDESGKVPDFSDLLATFDDPDDRDDQVAAELDPGVDIAESGDDEDAGEREADLGDILVESSTLEPLPAGDDETGPDEGDIDLALADDEGGTTDEGEGAGEPLSELVSEDLPALDADEEGDIDLPSGVPVSEEDEGPPQSELPWVHVPVPSAHLPRYLVVLAGSRVVAAGADIVVIDEAGAQSTLCAEPNGEVTSVIAGREPFVFATASGRLFRTLPGSSTAEPIETWRDAAGLAGTAATPLWLGGPTPSSRPAMLLHVPEGRLLLESTDHGTTFRRVDLGGRVSALSSGSPPLCLVETAAGMRLLRSEPSGGFSVILEDWPCESERVRIAADGSVVAVLEPGRGVYVSADAGATLRKVPGCTRATAIAVGRLGGRPSVFTTLFDPSSGRTALVWIDAAAGDGWVVGHIEVEAEDDDDLGRVASLAWDSQAETVWAAGPFGLRCFRRPPSA